MPMISDRDKERGTRIGRQLWSYINDKNWDEARKLLSDDFEAFWPQKNIRALNVLPEERPSLTPTAEQILRVFEPRTRHLLYEKEKLVRTFTDPLTQVQKEVLWLIRLPIAAYQ